MAIKFSKKIDYNKVEVIYENTVVLTIEQLNQRIANTQLRLDRLREIKAQYETA